MKWCDSDQDNPYAFGNYGKCVLMLDHEGNCTNHSVSWHNPQEKAEKLKKAKEKQAS
jgi:hypothetical protein